MSQAQACVRAGSRMDVRPGWLECQSLNMRQNPTLAHADHNGPHDITVIWVRNCQAEASFFELVRSISCFMSGHDVMACAGCGRLSLLTERITPYASHLPTPMQ